MGLILAHPRGRRVLRVQIALSAVLIAGCVLAAGWATVLAARGRRMGNHLLITLIVVELLTLAQLVVAVVAVAGGRRPDVPDSAATFLAYAVSLIVLLPAGVFWSQIERSASSTLVITVACLGVAVMSGRMMQMWGILGA
jgi:hypothetical protein